MPQNYYARRNIRAKAEEREERRRESLPSQLDKLIFEAINAGKTDSFPVYSEDELGTKRRAIGRIYYIEGEVLDWLDHEDPNADYDDYVLASYGGVESASDVKRSKYRNANAIFRGLSPDFHTDDGRLEYLQYFSRALGIMGHVTDRQRD